MWTGTDATEERAKSVGRGARVLHFACHGFLDEAFPLDSGLVLAIPPQWKEAQDNGFLQAREVFEGKPLRSRDPLGLPDRVIPFSAWRPW